ncbi:exopolysaccharide biosynthesis polyprenyl glycosylphosphotransferase [Streptomyces sp. WAC05374]|uniref:exopolysaccharide biosynthesis polyprenyl glycosylphosphotransferase n=1 Tax=Streptomyces sp. WAC05374 TaxID=2487420 RepID=UPI000F880DF8|nr:exopolysaccharide biosynthesis polyprenyl glycosylphosphotransferase [Streptomyces sp. WAC05374]RST04429.1 exopolysaccharide biosynthesis polyprenyl glycosylphosphotransferase [Streptomyces sp. WAC05374]TDF40092.1 exopolysaccharide biosynthesis polyprenyl glycosylphosphotransferase [Streptomyces sp. WAC05374]TDF56106.1 exopolysaccharide biosynthesis polyprenyl glycosylphosphotransferase [Streptomyces sp. WAC05374]TDF59722.1 exopolysaccharide biosynthesis polyprenyl glycosylphosphotransferase
MTTESTSPATTVVPPRGTADRPALPPRRPVPAPPFVASLVATDCAAVLVAALVLAPEQRGAALLMQLTACLAALNAYAGLYRPAAVASVPDSVLDELPALAGRAAVAWCAAAALLAAQDPDRAVGPAALSAAYAVHLAFVCACRAVLHHRSRAAARAHPRSALVVGPAPAAQRLAAMLARHPEYGVRPVGIVDTHRAAAHAESSLPVLSGPEEIHRAVIQNSVRDALFTGADQPELVALLRHHGCVGWLVGDAAGDTPMSRHLWGHACRRLDPPPGHRGRLPKRVLDVTVAGLMLAALSPLLLLCAAAIRLSDGPGVVFRQERVGQDGKLFTLLKFRTLRPADDEEAATRWSVAHDERMSGVGTFLRRTSLDELPQLWNVLRGDMSLVGPRPERPYFVSQFSRVHPGYAARHRMPVGLTGLAQVHGLRGDTSIEDRCRFDNHYIDHWSLWQDVCILLRTAASLIRPAGS